MAGNAKIAAVGLEFQPEPPGCIRGLAHRFSRLRALLRRIVKPHSLAEKLRVGGTLS